MSVLVCRTCAVEYPDTDTPAAVCAICSDERQYACPSGQRWTTLEELAAAGHRGTVAEVEPGLHGITIKPSVGIGQRGLLVQTTSGNLLWDPNGYLDDAFGCGGSRVGRAGCSCGQPSTHVRGASGVVPPVRRCAGLCAGGRPGLGPARRSGDHHLGGEDRGAARRSAPSDWRPLPRQCGRSLCRG